ncbi:ACP S-malonyltransferase [Streptomyces apocyni]|uniref:ACP S-malonyltransferase n=1 Tax=Streptomyces apocyni TaxID=2654677 RepID=UPI0012EABBCD|nr:ACP S-malonyltransferase [Streptomyces apocyni]
MKAEPVALMFPGQGTQRQGMGEPWRDTASWCVTTEVSETIGEDIADILLNTPDQELRRTDLAQLAIFTVSVMAHHESVRSGLLDGEMVVACAGHSLGEYTALTAAGALTVGEAAALVAARGRAMRDAARQREGTMGVLVAAPLEAVQGLVDELRAAGSDVWVANVNAPGQTVLSGTVEGIERAAEAAPSIGAKMIRLKVGGAFHSPLMEPAAEALSVALSHTLFAPTHLPVVANVDAEPYSGLADWPALGARQLTHPVLWEQSVRTLTDKLGCRRLVELGPGRTLAGLVRRIAPDVEVVSVDSPGALDSTGALVG